MTNEMVEIYRRCYNCGGAANVGAIYVSGKSKATICWRCPTTYYHDRECALPIPLKDLGLK
jgi:hypothetical protein